MTPELKNLLDAEMEAAMESGDADRIRDAVAHATKALCDCQMKTADRVKTIASDHPQLVKDVKAIKEIVEGGKRKIIEVAASAVKWIIVGGGGAEFVRWLVTHSASSVG